MAEEATSLDAVTKLIQLFAGSGKQTTTQSSSMSSEGLQALVKQALESNQGLAQVSAGQAGAGLYNSSTNQLLTNDLLARLTAQAQSNSQSKTITTQQAGALSGNAGKALGGATVAGTLLKNLLGTGTKLATDSKSRDSAVGLFDKLKGLVSPSVSAEAGSGIGAITGVAAGDTAGVLDAANSGGGDAIANLMSLTNNFQDAATGGTDLLSSLGMTNDAFQTGAPADWLATLSNSSTSEAGNVATTGGDAANFQLATSAAGSTQSGTSLLPAGDVANDGSSLAGQLDAQNLDLTNSDLTSAYNAADGTSAVTSADLASKSTDILGGSGSSLGYLGSALYALNAPNNPEGAQNQDYRQAVGSAVLNYFGYGWATPIVDAVARPVLNAAMDAGDESLGVAGAFAADPIGMPLSGEYDMGDVISSGLDPANIFGGNPGGSTGALVGASIDPIGAALGDEGLFSVVKDGVNSVLGGLSGGSKVICTEMALQDKLPIGLYTLSIQPQFMMKPQMLRGYHAIGVTVVKALRNSPRFSNWIAPYVLAYVKHKTGVKRSWQGFWIKAFLHPISWVLGFWQKDSDYYKTLYTSYRRKRV